MRKNQAGYVLADLLVGLLMTAFVFQGTIKVLSMHSHVHTQQGLVMGMEQNLRMAMEMIVDTLRTAKSSAPTTNLTQWFPWVSGFSQNPKITSSPANITMARCTTYPVATLTSQAASGALTIQVTSAVAGESLSNLVNTNQKRLIQIGGTDNAHVVLAVSGVLTIDTNPTTTGNQGISRAYPVGTPICRVDVLEFEVVATGTVPALTVDFNQGAGPQTIAEGINNLQINTVVADRRYEIALTGRTRGTDPLTGTFLTRSLRSDVTIRNAS